MKYKVLFALIISLLIMTPEIHSYTLPIAKITLQVIDEDGKPMEGIFVGVGFEVPHKTERRVSGHAIKGFTDSKGLFTAQHSSMYDVNFGADKEGYYKSRGSFQFKKIQSGKLEPWNPTVELVLRKIEKPIPMYAREVIIAMPATGKEVGFDLIEADWVEPYGKGKKSDFILKLDRVVKSWNEFEGSIRLTFPNKFDGIQLIKEDRKYGSELKLPRFAPEEGYEVKLKKYNRSLADRPYEEDYKKDNNYIFRIRSEEEDEKLVKAMYGKIHGDIRFDPREGKSGGIDFKYYLNPDYTQNLEFDPKRNLFRGLKSYERVGLN